MSIDAPEVSSANALAASGQTEQPPIQEVKDSVAYDTYKRVLSEKKKRDEQLGEMSARLQQLEAEQKDRQEQELKAKEDYKKLLELRDKELFDTKSKLKEFSMKQTISAKAQAFVNAVGGLKKDDYLNLVDFERIIMNEDGEIDDMSLESYKEEWITKFPETLKDKKAPPLPSAFPKGNASQPDSKRELLERLVSSRIF